MFHHLWKIIGQKYWRWMTYQITIIFFKQKKQQPSAGQNRKVMPLDKGIEKDDLIMKPKQRMRKVLNLTYYQLAAFPARKPFYQSKWQQIMIVCFVAAASDYSSGATNQVSLFKCFSKYSSATIQTILWQCWRIVHDLYKQLQKLCRS